LNIDLTNKIDFILLDMPIGGIDAYSSLKHQNYRPVELAFANAVFIPNTKIQYPRFQGGVKHADAGLKLAQKMRATFGNESCSVIESFPQLSIPPLMQHKSYLDSTMNPTFKINKLSTHKANKKNAENMWNLLNHILKRNSDKTVDFNYRDHSGIADLCDSVLGALPILDYLSNGKFLSKDVVWLLNNPGNVAHPYTTTKKNEKMEMRKSWMVNVNLSDFTNAVMDKGILSYRL
jgi:hypothetical protein